MRVAKIDEYLQATSDCAYRIHVKDGYVSLVASVKKNTNKDGNMFEIHDIESDSFKPDGRTVFRIDLDESERTDKIQKVCDSGTCFTDILDWGNERATVLLFNDMEETADVLETVKDGNYIFVVEDRLFPNVMFGGLDMYAEKERGGYDAQK